jgi:hypothetical protein
MDNFTELQVFFTLKDGTIALLCKINARFSQVKAFSSVMTVVQRDRLAFMLGIKQNEQSIN